jgi:uncharacterized delta-60 repeat protein
MTQAVFSTGMHPMRAITRFVWVIKWLGWSLSCAMLMALTSMLGCDAKAQAASGDLDISLNGIGLIGIGTSRSPGSILLQADGRMLISGVGSVDGKSLGVLVRVTPNGSLDNSFGTGGVATNLIGVTNSFVDMAMQPDGKIVLIENAYGDDHYALATFLIRYLPNGKIDTSFGKGGIVLLNERLACGGNCIAIHRLAIQQDGKILVVGDEYGGARTTALAKRFTRNGEVDFSFADQGVAYGVFEGQAMAVELAPDGKIIILGNAYTTATNTTATGFALVRLLSDGRLDTSFGDAGRVISMIGAPTRSYALAVQPDGKVIAGIKASQYTLARFGIDGQLDHGFGINGVTSFVMTQENDELTLETLLLQADGHIIAVGNGYQDLSGGFAVTRGVNSIVLARYRADGSLDTAFGDQGTVSTRYSTQPTASLPTSQFAVSSALLPDGRIVVLGHGGLPGFVVLRYLGDHLPMTLRDAVYLYNQPFNARGDKVLAGVDCDVFQLVLDVNSGHTRIAMGQGDSFDASLANQAPYVDPILSSDAMFAYALYRDRPVKTFTFYDPATPSSAATIGTGTVFGYCYGTKSTAHVVFQAKDNCSNAYSDGRTTSCLVAEDGNGPGTDALANQTLRDAIYLYGQPLNARGDKMLVGEHCDVFQMVLDVTSGHTDLAMTQSDRLDAYAAPYADRILDNAAMFSYALYDPEPVKAFTFNDKSLTGSSVRTGTATVFGYCYSADPSARVYFREKDRCMDRFPDGSTLAISDSICVP